MAWKKALQCSCVIQILAGFHIFLYGVVDRKKGYGSVVHYNIMTTLNSSQLPLPFQDMHPATTKILRKVFFLHIPMLLSLYVLTDDDTYYTDDNTQRHHLAVFTALQRHPPSARVFRCLLEFVLLGFCTSFSICVWERVVGKEMLGRLMFDTPYTLIKDEEEQTSEFEMVSSLLESRECGDIDDTPSEDAIITSGSSDQSSSGEPDNEDNGKICSPFKQRLPPQPPSAAAICNASLDILLLILVFLFLFIISSSAGGQYIDQTNQIFLLAKVGEIAAPVFPLLLFFLCFIQLLFPWTETKMQLWTTVSYTIGAPMFKVTFRDGFIGDVFTSVVRPLQDLAFTSFYVASGLRGWWTYREETTEEHIINPVEQSWLLHTVILPACMISPLWWRYSQTLRQTFDHKKRWPYLGNAAKYFFAAQVAVIGVYDPQMKSNVIWLAGFVFATLYQVRMDVFRQIVQIAADNTRQLISFF